MKVACFCVGMNIILNLILMGPFLHVGMAMATSLAAWTQTALLIGLLMRQGERLFTKPLCYRLFRLALACALMGVGLWVAQRYLTIVSQRLFLEIIHLGWSDFTWTGIIFKFRVCLEGLRY